jgi:hypothetical protein
VIFIRWRSNYQDNARPHTAKVAMDALTEVGGTPLKHPPYSTDLTPSDFWVFPTMKRSKPPVPLSSWSLRQTVCCTFSISGWSVVRSASLDKGDTSKKRPSPHLHQVYTRNNVSPRIFKRPSYTGDSFHGSKAPENGADCSLSNNAQTKHTWICTSP